MSELATDHVQALKALLRKETALSAVINAVISMGFFFLVFHWSPATRDGLAIDCLPQTLGVTLLGGLAPSMIQLSRVRKGAVTPAGPIPTLGRQTLKVLGCALVAVPVLGGAAALLFHTLAPLVMAPRAALIAKALYGALVGVITTPPILRMALGMAPWGRVRARMPASPRV